MVGEAVHTWAQIKAMAPNCPGSHCVFHCHTQYIKTKKETKPVSLKNVLDETDLIISWLWGIILLKNRYEDEVGNMHNYPYTSLLALWSVNIILRKRTCAIGLQAEIAASLVEHHFHLEKWLTGKLWLFTLEGLAVLILEMNEVNEPVISRGTTIFLLW